MTSLIDWQLLSINFKYVSMNFKFLALIAILIGCVAFVSCERATDMLEPAVDSITDDGTTTDGTADADAGDAQMMLVQHG